MLILACDPTFSPILLNYIYAITNAKKKKKKIVRYSFSIEGRWKVKKRTAATHTRKPYYNSKPIPKENKLSN